MRGTASSYLVSTAFLASWLYSTTLHLIGSALPLPGVLSLSLPKLSSSRREQSARFASICKLLAACLWRSFLFPGEVLWVVLQCSDQILFGKLESLRFIVNQGFGNTDSTLLKASHDVEHPSHTVAAVLRLYKLCCMMWCVSSSCSEKGPGLPRTGWSLMPAGWHLKSVLPVLPCPGDTLHFFIRWLAKKKKEAYVCWWPTQILELPIPLVSSLAGSLSTTYFSVVILVYCHALW